MCLSSVVEDTRSPKPEDVLEKKERHSALKEAIEALGEKDKLVMGLYYYEKMTLKEIGEVMGISESRVCQLHSRAILRLRDNLKKLNY
jgi:RNA polymerase sigma factor for flagellar operon FliA